MKFVLPFSLILLSGLAIANGFASPDSLGETGLKWDRTSLRLCFVRGDQEVDTDLSSWTAFNHRHSSLSESRKRLIRNLLDTNYSQALTGISLVGFEDCSSPLAKTNADILVIDDIFYGDGKGNDEALSGISSLGAPEKTPGNGEMKAAIGLNHREARELRREGTQFFFDKFGDLLGNDRDSAFDEKATELLDALDDANLQYTVLHEFGHAIGLQHEDARKDLPNTIKKGDPMCGWSREVGSGKSVLPNGELSTFGTDYDIFSIMSYCRQNIMAYVYRARLVCAYRNELAGRTDLAAGVRDALNEVLGYCEFLDRNEFPLGLSLSDKIGVSKLYETQWKASAGDDAFESRSAKTKTWFDIGVKLYSLQKVMNAVPSAKKIIERMRKEGRSYLK